jgi:hypothetical protein
MTFLVALLGLTHGFLEPSTEPQWQPVATGLLKTEKTGFGGLCGIVVDHQTGEVWVNLSDRGMFRSADQSKTWKRASETQPKGRTETPGCWLFDPTGKTNTMVTALVYGSPIAVSADQAAAWRHLDNKSSHIDWCAVDWSDPEMKFVLALKHESGGLLLVSNDGGKTFAEAGKGFGPGWVFDGQTAVVAEAKTKDRPKPNLLRTTDGGKSFQPCGAYSPVGTNSAGAPQVAGRRPLLARGRRAHRIGRQGRDLEEAGRSDGRAIRPDLRQGHQPPLRPDQERCGGKHRRRRDLVDTACTTQGDEGH